MILSAPSKTGERVLIIEDGTMPAGADSYATLADADAILVPRGIWAATPVELPDDIVAVKESALIRATDWLNTQQWKGDKPDWQRVMAWPRSGISFPDIGSIVVPDNIVPDAVKRACIELAGIIHGGVDPLAPVERNGTITSWSKSTQEGNVDIVGGDSESISVTYAQGVSPDAYYPSIVPLIAPFLKVLPGKKSSFAVIEIGRG